MEAQTNQFNKGLNLDTNPATISNEYLTDALNGTLISFNGNDMSYQNDLGNARIHNARLKPGFIPLGMKEYGGVIYVASHNPLSGDSEVGSFPSPERNHNYNFEDKSIEQSIDVNSWFNTECSSNGSKSLPKPMSQSVGIKDTKGKDVLLNPGDLYKIALSNLNPVEKTQVEWFFNKQDKATYHKLRQLGLQKKYYLSVSIRNLQGITEDVTESLFDDDMSLNNAFILNSALTFNKQGDRVISEEEALNNYRENVKKENFHIYSGKSSGYLQLGLKVNTLKDFSMSYSYLVKEENKDKNIYLLFKVFVNPNNNKEYMQKISGISNISDNDYVFLKSIEAVNMKNPSNFSAEGFKNKEESIKFLEGIFGEGTDYWKSSYTTPEFFGMYVFKYTLPKKKDSNDPKIEFNYSFVPQSTVASECFHKFEGKINIDELLSEDLELKLNRWNYRCNIDNTNPLELNFGFSVPKNELYISNIGDCIISFYDIYFNRDCNYHLKISNNGNNFSERTLYIPYIELGQAGRLNTKEENDATLKQAVYDSVNTTYIDNKGNKQTGNIGYYNSAKDSTNLSGININSNKEILADKAYLIEEDNTNYIPYNEITSSFGRTPLILNNVYLCKIQLLDKVNNKPILTDYRFIITNGGYDNETDLDFKDLKGNFLNNLNWVLLTNENNISVQNSDDPFFKEPLKEEPTDLFLNLSLNLSYGFNGNSSIGDIDKNKINTKYAITLDSKPIIEEDITGDILNTKILNKVTPFEKVSCIKKKTSQFYNSVNFSEIFSVNNWDNPYVWKYSGQFNDRAKNITSSPENIDISLEKSNNIIYNPTSYAKIDAKTRGRSGGGGNYKNDWGTQTLYVGPMFPFLGEEPSNTLFDYYPTYSTTLFSLGYVKTNGFLKDDIATIFTGLYKKGKYYESYKAEKDKELHEVFTKDIYSEEGINNCFPILLYTDLGFIGFYGKYQEALLNNLSIYRKKQESIQKPVLRYSIDNKVNLMCIINTKLSEDAILMFDNPLFSFVNKLKPNKINTSNIEQNNSIETKNSIVNNIDINYVDINFQNGGILKTFLGTTQDPLLICTESNENNKYFLLSKTDVHKLLPNSFCNNMYNVGSVPPVGTITTNNYKALLTNTFWNWFKKNKNTRLSYSNSFIWTLLFLRINGDNIELDIPFIKKYAKKRALFKAVCDCRGEESYKLEDNVTSENVNRKWESAIKKSDYSYLYIPLPLFYTDNLIV